MPQLWDPETYRLRALEWREKAETLSVGEERNACLVIAEGYNRLAQLIEQEKTEADTKIAPPSGQDHPGA